MYPSRTARAVSACGVIFLLVSLTPQGGTHVFLEVDTAGDRVFGTHRDDLRSLREAPIVERLVTTVCATWTWSSRRRSHSIARC